MLLYTKQNPKKYKQIVDLTKCTFLSARKYIYFNKNIVKKVNLWNIISLDSIIYFFIYIMYSLLIYITLIFSNQ